MLLACLIATLTPSVLPHIVGTCHTREVWSKLEEKISLLSRTHVMDLKRRLYTLKKNTPMEQYLDHIKGLLQKLEASGPGMDEEDVVFHTLNGLPNEEYITFKQAIRTRSKVTPLTFGALYSVLMVEDLCHESLDTSTILIAQHQNPSSSSLSGPSLTIHHPLNKFMLHRLHQQAFSFQFSLVLKDHNLIRDKLLLDIMVMGEIGIPEITGLVDLEDRGIIIFLMIFLLVVVKYVGSLITKLIGAIIDKI